MNEFILVSKSGYNSPYGLNIKNITDAAILAALKEDGRPDVFSKIVIATQKELKIDQQSSLMNLAGEIVGSRKYMCFEIGNIACLPELKIPANTKVVIITKVIANKIPVFENSEITFVDIANIRVDKNTLICVNVI